MDASTAYTEGVDIGQTRRGQVIAITAATAGLPAQRQAQCFTGSAQAFKQFQMRLERLGLAAKTALQFQPDAITAVDLLLQSIQLLQTPVLIIRGLDTDIEASQGMIRHHIDGAATMDITGVDCYALTPAIEIIQRSDEVAQRTNGVASQMMFATGMGGSAGNIHTEIAVALACTCQRAIRQRRFKYQPQVGLGGATGNKVGRAGGAD